LASIGPGVGVRAPIAPHVVGQAIGGVVCICEVVTTVPLRGVALAIRVWSLTKWQLQVSYHVVAHIVYSSLTVSSVVNSNCPSPAPWC
jgi:hypothetical protein